MAARQTPRRVKCVDDPRAGLLFWRGSGRALLRAQANGASPAQLLDLLSEYGRSSSTKGRSWSPSVCLFDVLLLLLSVNGDEQQWRHHDGPQRLREAVARQEAAIDEALRNIELGIATEAEAWVRSPAPKLDAWQRCVLAAHPGAGEPFEQPKTILDRVSRTTPSSAESIRELAQRHRKALIELGLIEKDPTSAPRCGRYRRTPAGDLALQKIRTKPADRFH